MTPEVRILNQDAAGDLLRLRRSALLSSMIISSRSCCRLPFHGLSANATVVALSP
jgi:hypothetical protein